MFDWHDDEAAARRQKSLDRTLTVSDVSPQTNFASNDYLGLARDPRVISAACQAAQEYGWGSGASPLVSGWRRPHEELARDLAAFEKTEAVALFPTGFAANLGTITALVGRGDAVYLDRLNHACLIDGARLSGATLRVYPHCDSARLRAILERDRGRFRRSLIATDGVFSMDGDLAPLDELANLAEEFGAMLMVDEAHGTGVFGPDGRGAASEFGVCDRIPIRVGTLSKALGSIGGFVAGSRRLIDHLINRSRTLIYSTSLPPAAVAAAREALRISIAEPWRRERTMQLGQKLRTELLQNSLQVSPSKGPIVPLAIGDPTRTLLIAGHLRDHGILVGAIRPPTVPDGTSRLRISVTAAHLDTDVENFIKELVHFMHPTSA